MKSLSSIVLGSTLALGSSCTYLHPKGNPIYESMQDSVSQNDGRYSIPAINIAGAGWIQPELSDRVVEGELPIFFKPLRNGTKIVKDRFVGKDWDLETSTVYVTPVYLVGDKPATEATFRIGEPYGIPIEVTNLEKSSNLAARTFSQSDHKYRPQTMLIDTDRNPKTPKVEFYFPVIRDSSNRITATLMIDASKTKEVIDWETGQLTLRTAPGDIHYLNEIPSTTYQSRAVTVPTTTNVTEPSQTVIVK